jgi:hypothetical protein
MLRLCHCQNMATCVCATFVHKVLTVWLFNWCLRQHCSKSDWRALIEQVQGETSDPGGNLECLYSNSYRIHVPLQQLMSYPCAITAIHVLSIYHYSYSSGPWCYRVWTIGNDEINEWIKRNYHYGVPSVSRQSSVRATVLRQCGSALLSVLSSAPLWRTSALVSQ